MSLRIVFLKDEHKCICSICNLGEIKKMEQWNTNHVELHKTFRNKHNGRIKSCFQPTGRVYSGIVEIDEVLGGVYTGQVTAFVGKSKLLSSLLHRICVKTFDMFHSPVIVLDAGNQLNPYLIARFARLQMLSAQEVLEQVYLSRTYTVYQLTDLIYHHVDSFIQQVKPVTIMLTGLFSLLKDADISEDERYQLLQIVMKKIKQITTKYHVAMVLIDTQYSGYDNTVFDACVDTTVRLKDMHHCPRMTITQKNQQVTVTSETFGQLCLHDFGMEE